MGLQESVNQHGSWSDCMNGQGCLDQAGHKSHYAGLSHGATQMFNESSTDWTGNSSWLWSVCMEVEVIILSVLINKGIIVTWLNKTFVYYLL